MGERAVRAEYALEVRKALDAGEDDPVSIYLRAGLDISPSSASGMGTANNSAFEGRIRPTRENDCQFDYVGERTASDSRDQNRATQQLIRPGLSESNYATQLVRNSTTERCEDAGLHVLHFRWDQSTLVSSTASC